MKKFFFYALAFTFFLIIIETFSFIIINKLENHRFIQNVIANSSNLKSNKSIFSKYDQILPYIRQPQRFNDQNNFKISYDEKDLFFTTISEFNNQSKNILFQGDSWAEQLSKKDTYNYLKEFSDSNNYGLVNSGIRSYSPSPMAVQLYLLRKDFNLKPNIIVALLDQTDIGDELYRYNIPNWQENKINYFDKSHEASLVQIFTKKNFNSIKLISLIELYYSSNFKKFSTHKKTIVYIFNRLKNFAQGIPSVMSPIVNGVSDQDIDLFASRVENYIDISFQDNNLEYLIFVTHPHKIHFEGKRYKIELGNLLEVILNNSNYRKKIFHVNFAKIDEIKSIKPDIMFAKNDVYSHLNEKMYLKYYLPEILKKLNIVIK